MKLENNISFILNKFEFSLIRSGIAKTKDANMIGIDKSIEYIAADSLFNPINLDIVITTPERLAPGIKAKHWNIPITRASLKEIFS